MDNSSTATAAREQTDEEILTCTVSDEALEAAAGTETSPNAASTVYHSSTYNGGTYCCPSA